jgi:hypothetical protein
MSDLPLTGKCQNGTVKKYGPAYVRQNRVKRSGLGVLTQMRQDSPDLDEQAMQPFIA